MSKFKDWTQLASSISILFLRYNNELEGDGNFLFTSSAAIGNVIFNIGIKFIIYALWIAWRSASPITALERK